MLVDRPASDADLEGMNNQNGRVLPARLPPDRSRAGHPPSADRVLTGAATALGAGVSMAFSEGLSDTGDLTGRGRPVPRGEITGGGTFAAAGDRAPMPSENPSPTCIRGHNRQAPKLADTC
jgi:hypothetical protein